MRENYFDFRILYYRIISLSQNTLPSIIYIYIFKATSLTHSDLRIFAGTPYETILRSSQVYIFFRDRENL